MQFIPFGFNCSVANALRVRGLRQMSLPFDWLDTPDLDKLVELLLNDCHGLFDLEPIGDMLTPNDYDEITCNLFEGAMSRHNRKYNIRFVHHDPIVVSSHKAAFERRIIRLYELLNYQCVLVRLCSSVSEFNDVELYKQRINSRWPNVDLKLVMGSTTHWRMVEESFWCEFFEQFN